MSELGVTQRRACLVLGQHRSTQRQVSTRPDDEAALTADIVSLAVQYGRYGYRRIEWKARGYLSFAGDLVDVALTNARLAAVGKSRLDPVTLKPRIARTLRKPVARGDTSRGQAASRHVTPDVEAFPWVQGASLMAAACSDLVLALVDHLPMATVRPLVEGVVAKARADVAAIADEEEGAPKPFASWAEHPWFTRPPLTEAEWAELAEERRKSSAAPVGSDQ